MGVGQPRGMLLHHWGRWVREAFPDTYHVGSSVIAKDGWRDVDIRAILDDDEFAALFPGVDGDPKNDARWSLICSAISLMGEQMTGLLIDFQIQSATEADGEDGVRSAIGITVGRTP